MGDSEFIVVLVALIVTAIALIVTAFQLSAQISLTAEGQRKCSESLLSVWSKDPTTKTRWKWRWSEARFELQFVTPEICLGTSALPTFDEGSDKKRSRFGVFPRTVTGAGRTPQRKTESLLGADSELDYLLFLSALAYNAPDMVSWLSFLTFLRLETSDWEDKTTIEETLDTSLANGVAPGETCNPNLAPLELSWPRVRYHVHSWDYMPPNAPKPFAKLNIHDVAVIVRRLGMVWKTFDPKNGDMSAEDGDHILTSNLIQGLGLVLEYRCLDDRSLATRVSKKVSVMLSLKTNPFTQSQRAALEHAQDDAPRLAPEDFQKSDEESQSASEIQRERRDDRGRIAQKNRTWSKEMDKFVFGLVPGDPRLGLPDYPFVEVSDRLNVVLSRSDRDNADLREELLKDKYLDWQYSFNDMMAIVPPTLKTLYTGIPTTTSSDNSSVFDNTHSTFRNLLRAFLNGAIKGHESPFESMRQNNSRLTEENLGETMLGRTGLLQGRDDGGTTQMKVVLDGVEDLIRRKKDKSWSPGSTLSPFAEKMQEYHDSTTQYFIENEAKINIRELLEAFLSKAPLAAGRVRGDGSEGTYITEYRETGQGSINPLENSKFSCILEHYFSYIPGYVKDMRKRSMIDGIELSSTGDNDDLIIEAWLTLMWRGYLFRQSHMYTDFEGIHVPREYYGSRLPVYMI